MDKLLFFLPWWERSRGRRGRAGGERRRRQASEERKNEYREREREAVEEKGGRLSLPSSLLFRLR